MGEDHLKAFHFQIFMGIFVGMTTNTDTINITPEVLAIIAEIDEFKGAWKALSTLAQDRL